MYLSLPKTIREFLDAATNPYSYNPLRNIYIWFGILWGVPIPLVTIVFELHYLLEYLDSFTFNTALETIFGSPVQWFFIAHPVLFAFVFGILGTIRHEKENELMEKIHQLEDLTSHDPLTGLKNRRYFVNIFYEECARSYRRGESLTLLFLDIDHFKQINDTHGHHFGDVVLSELGRYLLRKCRPYDTAVRWGGEEFLILLRATGEKSAMVFAERIRTGVEGGFSRKVSIAVTLSIGLAEHQVNDTLEILTDRADRALYQAKQNGRNRVVCWSELDQESEAEDG